MLPCGLKVLLVEAEPLVAMDIEDMLRDIGCEVVAVASTLPEAINKAGIVEVDIALVDVFFGGEPHSEIAGLLAKRTIPVLFTAPPSAGQSLDGRTMSKPFGHAELSFALVAAARPQKGSTDA